MAVSTDPSEERTYHATQSAYVLPNDNTEHRRLEAQAERLRELVGNKIVHAPLEAPSVNKIVEIGCGTGITTDEFGATYSQARVFGVDLSPVPALRPKPKNVEYIQGDVFELKTSSSDERLARGSFDYVFSRALIAGMNKWDEYLKLCVALAKPGAWIEMHEPDLTLHLTPPASGNAYDSYSRNPSLEELEVETLSVGKDPVSWRTALQSLFRSCGLDSSIGSQLPKHFEDAGLEDIRIERYVFPYGTWEGMTDAQRRYAPINEAFVRNDLPHLIRKLASVTGSMSDEEAERIIEDSKAFVTRYNGNREFGWIYVVCGRKQQAG